MLAGVVRKPLQISSEDSYVNLTSETSDEIYSALSELSRNLIAPQGMTKKENPFEFRKLVYPLANLT